MTGWMFHANFGHVDSASGSGSGSEVEVEVECTPVSRGGRLFQSRLDQIIIITNANIGLIINKVEIFFLSQLECYDTAYIIKKSLNVFDYYF